MLISPIESVRVGLIDEGSTEANFFLNSFYDVSHKTDVVMNESIPFHYKCQNFANTLAKSLKLVFSHVMVRKLSTT